MRHALLAIAFALACAAATASAQSGRVKRPEPAAQPSPAQQPAGQQQGAARKDDLLSLAKRNAAADDDAEPERDEAGNRVYRGIQVDSKARIISKPDAVYPRGARRHNVQGEVVLRLVLAASGKVENVTVVKGLPNGVTEAAIKAARQIKFVPAEKDGRKVSQRVTIHFNFNLY